MPPTKKEPGRYRARLPQRPDAVWLEALRSRASAPDLVRDLESYLRRILATTLRRRSPSEDDLDELTQEAFAQLLSYVHTFRGDSSFPTWAAAVATRVAFTSLRRRAAQAEQHASFQRAREAALAERERSRSDTPEATLNRQGILDALDHSIDAALTDKQRVATLALLRGVPTIEIAERTGSNQNAVYKLVHDARLRLRQALEQRGVTVELVLQVTTEGA